VAVDLLWCLLLLLRDGGRATGSCSAAAPAQQHMIALLQDKGGVLE
jgi:hypothetical protein